MAKGDIHPVPHRDGWANLTEGNTRVTKTHDTKRAAQADGRESAIRNDAEDLVHRAVQVGDGGDVLAAVVDGRWGDGAEFECGGFAGRA